MSLARHWAGALFATSPGGWPACSALAIRRCSGHWRWSACPRYLPQVSGALLGLVRCTNGAAVFAFICVPLLIYIFRPELID